MADPIDPRIESLLVDLKRREQTSDAEVSALRQAIGESP